MQRQRANAIREKRILRSRSCSPSLRKQGVCKRVYATGDSYKYKYKYERNIIANKCTCAIANNKCH